VTRPLPRAGTIPVILTLALGLLPGCGPGPEDLPRVLVVAIEGADLDFVNPMMEEGRLPTFARLFREGTHGTLHSVIPPVTPPAWIAATTGKNPGRTGVYQWAVLAPGTYRGDPSVAAKITLEKRVWDLVGEAGGRVIVINIPLTFPPIEVNGVIVCGLPADENGTFAYPTVLAEELRQRGYVPHFKSRQMLGDYLTAMRERAQMIAKYMRTLEWNLCMVSLKNLDEVCHYYIEDRELVESAYVEADRALGELVETAGPETTILVFSDHGYYGGPYERYFSVNRWLLEEELLSVRGWINDSLRVVPFGPEGPQDLGFGRYQILWPATRAFSTSDCHSNFGHIQINLRGREPSGVVEPGPEYESLIRDIQRRLLAYRDPQTGEQVVSHVFTREDLFVGDRVADLPEIFFETVRGVIPLGITISGFFELSDVMGPIVVGINHPYPGDHEREGLFVLAGPDVRSGVRLDTELVNLPPTLLYLMGIPVPPDFDGSVVRGALTDERLVRAPVQIGKNDARRKHEPQLIIAPEPPDAEAQEILNALGYFR